MFYVPEYNAKPHVDPKILEPGQTTNIVMVPGAEIQTQAQNFVPKKITAQLGVSNLVIWNNTGDSFTVSTDYENTWELRVDKMPALELKTHLISAAEVPPG